jgi:stage II sporulation protein GA (sporulation sigma-E factor processing peptidase)
VLGYIIVRYLIRRRARGNNIYPILLQNGECAVKVNGIYDSGNQLIDPYTGAGVSIVNREVAERLFKDAPPVRFVPYRSLGDDSGMLPVATIDELTITFGTSNITIHNVSIGIAEHELFTNVEYEIILHASYI